MKSPPRDVSTILGAGLNDRSRLRRIYDTAGLLSSVQSQLHEIMDPELCDHVWVSRFKGGVLVLCCDTAAHAARLRFTIPSLRSQLLRMPFFAQLDDIRVRVLDASPVPCRRRQPRMMRQVPEEAAAMLRDLGKRTVHPELGKALLELGHRKPDDE